MSVCQWLASRLMRRPEPSPHLWSDDPERRPESAAAPERVGAESVGWNCQTLYTLGLTLGQAYRGGAGRRPPWIR